jgi:hypothetical protein
MRKPNLSPHEQAIWNTITKEQQNVVTILVENCYEVMELEENTGMFDVIHINEVDAATYTTVDQYLVWRSITLWQKNMIMLAFAKMKELNGPDLMRRYDDDDVYNYPMDYDVFVLYNTFTIMNNDNDNLRFTFFNNQNQ